MERDGPPLLADGSLDYTESELFFWRKKKFLTCSFLLVEDPFSVLSFFVPEPQTRPHLVPLYPPLQSLTPLPPSTSISTSISTSSDVPAPHTRAFPSTTSLPLDFTPATLPFLDTNLQQQAQIKPPTSRRRHWTISRNTTRQKGKEREDDIDSFGGGGGGGFGVEVPVWQVAREAHAVDFGCFALLGAELEAEMRRRNLGVGVNGVNGMTGNTGEKEEDTILGLVRSSLDCSQAPRNVGSGEDGANAAPAAAPTPTIRTARTGANLLANAYWTSQRAAEAEDYIRDVVYGGVDGLAYVRSLAEFVGDHRVRVLFRRQ